MKEGLTEGQARPATLSECFPASPCSECIEGDVNTTACKATAYQQLLRCKRNGTETERFTSCVPEIIEPSDNGAGFMVLKFQMFVLVLALISGYNVRRIQERHRSERCQKYMDIVNV